MRTSTATNVGQDKDSEKRQRIACEQYAKAQGLKVVSQFFDADVQGKTDHLDRPGFSALVDYCKLEKVSLVLCEDATRFSRDLLTQERGYQDMKQAGLIIIPVKSPELFLDDTDDPSRTLMRQIIGAMAQYEKSSIVLKLKGARNRKREVNKQAGIITRTGKGKCEGRKSYQETNAELIREAKRLYRINPATGKRRSLREVSKELEKLGFQTMKGKTFEAAQVARLVA